VDRFRHETLSGRSHHSPIQFSYTNHLKSVASFSMDLRALRILSVSH